MAAQDLCTLAEVRLQMEMRTAYTDRDTLITELITQASDVIMREFEREFAPAVASATRTFPVYPRERDRNGNVIVDLSPHDLRTTTTVQVHPEASSPTTLTANTDYKLLPVVSDDAIYTRLLISSTVALHSDHLTDFGFAALSIAGAWGWATVPNEVNQACVETVKAWLDRLAPSGYDTDGGREFTPDMLRSFSIPTWARMKLQKFARHSQVF